MEHALGRMAALLDEDSVIKVMDMNGTQLKIEDVSLNLASGVLEIKLKARKRKQRKAKDLMDDLNATVQP